MAKPIAEPDYKTYLRICLKATRYLKNDDVAFLTSIKNADNLRERDQERLCLLYARIESRLHRNQYSDGEVS